MEYNKAQQIEMAQRRLKLVESELSVIEAKVAVLAPEVERLNALLLEAENGLTTALEA